MTKTRALRLMRDYYRECLDKPGRTVWKVDFNTKSNYKFALMYLARLIVKSSLEDPLEIIFSEAKQLDTYKKKSKVCIQIELYADMEETACNILDYLEALEEDEYDVEGYV